MDQTKQLDLEDERTAQKRYTEKLQERARRPVTYHAPANTIFTQDARPKLATVPEGQLVGRVALVEADPDLGGRSDFYIGERHINLDGIEVFSWAAPVACTYFRGTHHHEWCDKVAVIRSFAHSNGRIADLADDVLRSDVPGEPFKKRGLVIPAREGGARRPTPRGLPSATPPEAASPQPPTNVTQRRESTPWIEPEIRAEALLRSRLLAPRTKGLAPVLSTLQPDQYSLVTVPAMESMIIEGQPGTGKTIVAAHRAAWMVNDEMMAETPENGLDGNVLVVGPTDGHAAHVRGVVSSLTGGSPRVFVTSMPSLMRRIVHLREEPKEGASHSWMDVDFDLGRHARLALARFRKQRGVAPSLREAYDFLRTNGTPSHRITDDPQWDLYLRKLPPYEEARKWTAHLPLLAFLRWEIAVPVELHDIEHIIVDEAQDVSPLEWFLLTSINQAHAWTVLGDLNQRRSDYTLSSWKQVCDILLAYDEPKVHRLERGYRSTRPILEFANRLLPRGERALLAFQDAGPEPLVTRAREAELDDTIRNELRRLLDAYPDGTVAAIDTDPGRIRSILRADDWHTTHNAQDRWQKQGRELVVVPPAAARGLEFDAVVVVEPAAFPRNFGRQGPLYTSLTRPNRELAIVHSQPLPEELRPRRR
ncbi:hypothetical protein GCM10023221_27300 [Luteimicrobium xylanilyticum]|uniref:DNA helicase n=1 Tax=Luteimicrobium xylanilyticum TaxID=1133546 RepID=A0A5P9QDG3_9MICO|nr:AAA family ATPase [Luteimicrobium xylanilyticum]QFU98515.1 DNA helicase [Luteimicrobium xylanilyticum]